MQRMYFTIKLSCRLPWAHRRNGVLPASWWGGERKDKTTSVKGYDKLNNHVD